LPAQISPGLITSRLEGSAGAQLLSGSDHTICRKHALKSALMSAQPRKSLTLKSSLQFLVIFSAPAASRGPKLGSHCSAARASPAPEPWVQAGLAWTPVDMPLPLPCHRLRAQSSELSTWLAVGQPVGWVPLSVVCFQWATVVMEVDGGWKKMFAALCTSVQPRFYEPT